MASYVFRPRGKGYAFRIAVPKAVQQHFRSRSGKPLRRIIEGLGTDSRREAEMLAAQRRAHWLEAFERAKTGSALTPGEVDKAAREIYREMLQQFDANARHTPHVLKQHADLHTALRQLGEIEGLQTTDAGLYACASQLCQENGIELDPSSREPSWPKMEPAFARIDSFEVVAEDIALVERRTGVTI